MQNFLYSGVSPLTRNAKMNAPTDLRTLAALHRAAKENEAAARLERQAIEDQIVALTGLKDYGQKTVDRDGAKVTVKTNFSYALDLDKWDEMARDFPIAFLPYRIKREPHEAKIRALKTDHPDLYLRLSAALTVKPNRPTVDIVLTE